MWSVFKNFFGIAELEKEFNKNANELPIKHHDAARNSDHILSGTFGFSIGTDPLQMHSYLEKQMEDLFKNAFNFSNNFQGMDEKRSIEDSSLRDEFLKPGYNQHFHEDSDLDGVINSSDIENYFDGEQRGPTFFSRSVVIRSIRQPDGTIETVRIEQNNNEEPIVYDSGSYIPPNKRIELSDIDRITKLFF